MEVKRNNKIFNKLKAHFNGGLFFVYLLKKNMFKILLISILLSFNTFGQKQIITKSQLIINHNELILYLTDDTCSMVSKHSLKYSDFLAIDHKRDDRWHQDTYLGKYNEKYFYKTGYDMGHLTPSNITSYNDSTNYNSFSLFNEAPQNPSLNRGKWAKLEKQVEDKIKEGKSNCIIITGVIYSKDNTKTLPNSRIKIPSYFFKILVIKKKVYCWITTNDEKYEIKETTLKELNKLFKDNKMDLLIK